MERKKGRKPCVFGLFLCGPHLARPVRVFGQDAVENATQRPDRLMVIVHPKINQQRLLLRRSQLQKGRPLPVQLAARIRSEEHTSELQSLMRISYAVFCLNKKKHHKRQSKT